MSDLYELLTTTVLGWFLLALAAVLALGAAAAVLAGIGKGLRRLGRAFTRGYREGAEGDD